MRFLEVPDFHFSPVWIDVSLSCAARVRDAAIKNDVDFIALPGDFFDAPVANSDRGGLPDAISIIKSWLEICPVYAVYGTRSHDAPGCYAPLQEAGLIVLERGKPILHEDQVLLFGVPEPLDLEGFDDLMADYGAVRSAHPEMPAVMLLHGNVSDSLPEFETDPILSHSKNVMHTERLRSAGCDRYTMGHIHTPWESKRINGGYAGFPGMDRNPWGKTGFAPEFNLVDDGKITRIPYGTPRREKINAPIEYDPEVAYWLESSNIADVCPPGPWSRITYAVEAETSRRVDAETIDKAKTLSELAKIWDANISGSVLAKLNATARDESLAPSRRVRVASVEVSGCTLFHGSTVSANLAALGRGITQVSGRNGDGKSSLLAFATPYPCIVGKDTESGRTSALKDFFDGRESWIKKTVEFNGETHEHIILIEAAHTKTPKVKCTLTVDGVTRLDRVGFDEMMAECECIYGPFSEYLTTSFYCQPLQGKTESGLMTANMSTVRDLVQSLAGIDHTAERVEAMTKVKELEVVTSIERTKIEAERRVVGDRAALIELDRASREELAKTMRKLPAAEYVLSEAQTALAKLTALAESSDKARARVDELTKIVAEEETAIAGLDALEFEIACAKSKLNNAREEREAYQADLAEWQSTVERHQLWVAYNNAQASIAAIKHPCPQCGYIAPDVIDRIDEMSKIAKPEGIDAGDPGPMPRWVDQVAQCESSVNNLKAKLDRLAIIRDMTLPDHRVALADAQALIVDAVDTTREREAAKTASDGLAKLRAEQATLNASIVGIAKALDALVALDERERFLSIQVADLSDWQYIVDMLAPSKLPAMELEAVLDAIDREATDCVSPFRAGRYLFRTLTQRGAVDKFNILVIDRETGNERGLLQYSVGEKSFLSDAYTKALVKIRTSRSKTSYEPIILDEADSFIDAQALPEFWGTQRRYYADMAVLAVTHSPEAAEFIDRSISMEEVKHGN